MKRLHCLLRVLLLFALFSSAAAQDAGLVFTKDRAFPVVMTPLWKDEGLVFAGGHFSFSALLGYDSENEALRVGYSLEWNRKLTQNTTLVVGGAALVDARTVRWSELGDKVGIVLGVRWKL